MPARSAMVKLPPLAPRTPEQRVEARLQRVVCEPRGASRGGGGVLLRSERSLASPAARRPPPCTQN